MDERDMSECVQRNTDAQIEELNNHENSMAYTEDEIATMNAIRRAQMQYPAEVVEQSVLFVLGKS